MLSSFASNIQHFHRLDGKGYQLLGESIIEIDKFNPQLAARISNCFSQYHSIDIERQKRMKNILSNILEQPSLSKDTFEIVNKILNSN